MGNVFNRIKRPALRQGVIFGLILAVVEIAVSLASNAFQDANAQNILSIIALAAFLIAGYIAGQKASQETGKLGSGAAAGLWAGLIGSVVESLLPLVLILIYLPTIVAADQQDFKQRPSDYPGMKITDITSSYVLTGFAIEVLANVILYTLIALVGAALGGWLGKRRYQAVSPEFAVSSDPSLLPDAEQGGEARDLSDSASQV